MSADNNFENKFYATTSKWNKEIENNLKYIGDSCLGYKWMNIFVAKRNETAYTILMYIQMTLPAITGILSAISTDDITTLSTLVTIFSFLTGLLATVVKFSGFAEKASSYKSTAVKYASLESNIRRQLSVPREDRVNPGEYIEWISRSFDELFNSSPLITNDIYQEWVKFAKENNISIPKELGITVIDNNSDKLSQISSVNTIDVNTEHIEVVLKNKTEPAKTIIRNRTPLDGSSLDLQKFSDGKMKYEMARLFNMKY